MGNEPHGQCTKPAERKTMRLHILRGGIQILHASPREREQLSVVMVDTLLGPCMMDGWKGLPVKGKSTNLGSWVWGTGHGREAALLSTNMHACKWKRSTTGVGFMGRKYHCVFVFFGYTYRSEQSFECAM